ncbi:MAG: chemotaxis protein CheW [Gammaproteobacteria bacterium]|nr:chemotaxis protein CheW [Gammaproteobacteria bacterium]
MTETASSLTALRDQPFELLVALEQRCIKAAAGRGLETGAATDWVGVGFRVGEHLFVSERREVREIMTYPGATKVPGSKDWLKGLANVRGQLLPIIDLQQFFGGQESLPGRNTRVISVNHEDIPAGLMVDEVRGFRRFDQGDLNNKVSGLESALTPFVTGSFERGSETWYVMDFGRLVESQTFLQAAD